MISEELRSRMRCLYYAEHWKVGTIAAEVTPERVPKCVRNTHLALLHTFFEYIALRVPEMLEVAERVAAIPPKRAPPPETRFLERDEITTLFARLPSSGRNAARDRALFLFLYNTGARVQRLSICAGRTQRASSKHCSAQSRARWIEPYSHRAAAAR